MEISRRQFATMLGLAALSGVAHAAGQGAATPSPAASQGGSNNALLKELQKHGETPSPKSPSHGAAPAKAHAAPKHAAPKAAHDAHAAQAAHAGPTTPEGIWADLVEGNKRFMGNRPLTREYFQTREHLSKGQHPKVIVLGCADSRLSPELIFDKNLGELFVVRTAGNVADPIALGSIEYAAEHLHASLLVVLGHEKCGAVAATASGGKMPTANLQAIVDKIGPVTGALKEFFSGDDLVNFAVQANVAQSANDLLKHSPILQKEVAEKKLTIVKAVYRLKSGEVMRLG